MKKRLVVLLMVTTMGIASMTGCGGSKETATESDVTEVSTQDATQETVDADKKAADAKNQKEEAVIDAIIKDSEMNIPEAMLLTQQRQIVDDFARRLQMQGMSIEQYFQFTGLTVDKMLEQVRPNAERRIQSRLVLEAVAQAENIEVSEEDYEAELQKMADAYSMKVEEIEDMVGEFEQKAIKSDIKIKKAVDFVVAEAKEK